MFSPKVVEQKLASYTRLTGRTLKQYPVEFCQNAIKHFDSITIRDKKDQPTTWVRPLTADEQAFITNEQLMCQISYQYASERYCLIDDAESLRKRPLTLRLPQLFFMSFVWKLEELGLPIMIMVLKARQIGATTLAQAIIWFSVVFLKDISGVVASSDPDKSRDMVDKKLISMIELTPWWLTKAAKLRWVDSGEKILWSEDKTRNINITLAHGNQTSDIGRGTTFNRGHLTEICDWINEGRDHVEASLKYTFHPSPETFLLLESTAKGRDNYWHSLWLNSKEGWPKRKSQICPIFIPWYVARDIYPTQGWLNLTPVPKNWKPELKINNILITELHAKNAMEYVRSSEELRRELGADWVMPIEQQWWYEFNFEEAIRNDRLGTFLQECPASDLEAFQSPAKSIFSPLLITTLDQQVEQPKGVFTLLGDDIIPEWTIDSTEWAMRRDGGFFQSIPIKHKYQDVELNWALQPLKFNGYNETSSPLNRLFIWEWPKDNHEYAVALDTAGGEDKDRLVFQVIRKATSTERPVQVAEFASGNIAGLDCLPIWLCLLKLYTVRSVNSINYAMAAPEMMHDGPAVTQKLMSLGWPNFYIRKENEKGEQAYTTRSLVGFKTTAGTRPHLVTYLKNFLKTQKVKINSPWLIDEMRSFVRKVNGNTNKVREEHDMGQHDDRLFALAIGLVCLHDLDLYGTETPDWRDLNSAKEMLTRFATIKDCNLVSSANNLIDKFYGRGYDEEAMNRDDLIVTDELSDPSELDFNGHYASDLADLHRASKLDLEGALFEFSSYEGFVRAP